MIHLFWLAVLILAIPLSAIWLHYMRGNGHHRRGEAPPDRRWPAGGSYDDLRDLADRLQSRIETLERLMDVAQPEWRKQS